MNKLHQKIVSVMASVTLMASCSAALADGVVDTILQVGTTQAFTEEAVSSEDINTILQAGLATASAINQQPWYFVAVTNKDVMDQLTSSSGGFSGAPAGMQGAPAGAEGATGVPEGAPEGFDKASGAPAGAPSMPAGGSGSAKAALGDSPAAIIIYMNEATSSPNPNFDCGLAAQNMYLAAASLGYGVKIVTSPTMTLNGGNHDSLCELLGVDPSLKAVAVLLIGKADTDATSSATTRSAFEEKVSIIE